MGPNPSHPPPPLPLEQRSLQRFGYFGGGGRVEREVGWEVVSSEESVSSAVKYGPHLLHISGSNSEQLREARVTGIQTSEEKT